MDRWKSKTGNQCRYSARFIEIVETELGSLPEGNIARYRVLPEELMSWKENWRWLPALSRTEQGQRVRALKQNFFTVQVRCF